MNNMLTSVDVHNKDFPTKFKGYDPEEVNDFLDEVIIAMEELTRQNKDLEKRAKFNEEKIEYFNSIQETLNKSIIVAQEAADRLKENARKDAEIIIFEAEKAADQMLKNAADTATDINRETDSLKKATRVFRQRLQIMVQSQLEMIKNEEWDELLSPQSIEVQAPTLDAILSKRAKKTDAIISEAVSPVVASEEFVEEIADEVAEAMEDIENVEATRELPVIEFEQEEITEE
ncbi:cell division initiation protein [Granulicatella balaenopterae]|uniref:Cell division initiation protein n=1 Tax=Granulicatella balaenopterae TaxID=137733 RepID=A0A1H9IBY2_9LACT|nr:DivIVA domain-containing protein [Granulicatella balaenopterae]SEQ72048.1 cell division initiation protein [Granulicatella balaenopterae]